MKRRLALKSEYLTELTNDDLALVAGGVTTQCFTGYYPSINAPCPTTDCFVVHVRTLDSNCPTYGCLTGTTSG